MMGRGGLRSPAAEGRPAAGGGDLEWTPALVPPSSPTPPQLGGRELLPPRDPAPYLRAPPLRCPWQAEGVAPAQSEPQLAQGQVPVELPEPPAGCLPPSPCMCGADSDRARDLAQQKATAAQPDSRWACQRPVF